jgi:hypothetical protein
MITDPKALSHILHKTPYRFQRPPEMRGLVRLLAGTGVTTAEGFSSFNYQNVIL